MDSAALARRISLVTFLGGLSGGLVFPILPALGLRLGISGIMIGVILAANRMSRLVLDAPAGRIIDRVGGRRSLGIGLFVEAAGVLCFSAALHIGPALWWLLGGRILWGVGSAFLIVGAQATVLRATTDVDRGRRTATVRVAMSSGMPAGLILGGVIADVLSDDAAFLTGAAVTLLGAVLALLLVPPAGPRRAVARPSVPPGPGRLRALVRLPHFPFVAAAWAFNLLVFLTMQGILLATLVVLVQERGFHVFGLAAQGTAGLVMAVLMAISSAAAVAIGRRLDRAAARASLLVPALVGLAAGFVVLGVAPNLWLAVLGAALVGLSYNGITLPMLALLGDVTRREHGRAVGLYQVFGDIGGSLGPIIGLWVGTAVGLLPLYLAVAVALVLAEIAALWLLRRERRLGPRDQRPALTAAR
jgi:MFS family permease